MTLLLMLDQDRNLLSAVTRTLRHDGVEVIGVDTVSHALERVLDREPDALVLDADLVRSDDIERFRSVPLILTTLRFGAEDGWHWSRGRPVLHKPFVRAELLSLLDRVLGSRPSPAASMVDLLRRAHTARRTVALRVGNGEVFVEGGELVHAELEGISGEAALARLLTAPEPDVVCIADRAVERTIHKPFRALLLELLCSIEERERAAARMPPRLELVRGGRR